MATRNILFYFVLLSFGSAKAELSNAPILSPSLGQLFKKPKVFIELKVGKTPVGVGAYYSKGKTVGKLFEFVLGQSLGSAKALTLVKSFQSQKDIECEGTTFIDGTYHNSGKIIWSEEDSHYQLAKTEGNSQFWLDPLLLGRSQNVSNPLTKDLNITTLFPYNPPENQKFLFPCGDFREGIASQNPPDSNSPFVQEAKIPWIQEVDITASPIPYETFVSTLESLKLSPPDWQLVLGASSFQTNSTQLLTLAKKCEDTALRLENEVLRELAQAPYFTIQRISQIKSLCREISGLKDETKNQDHFHKSLFHLIVKEQNNPESFHQKFSAGPGNLLKNIAIQEHAAQIFMKYIPAFLDEVQELVALEKKRKIPVTVRLGLTGYKRGATLLGSVNLISKSVSTSIELANPDENNKGWLKTPPELSQFSYASGLSFARGDIDKNAIGEGCQKGLGYIGLDLIGNEKNDLVDAEWYRGTWSLGAQIGTAYQFLLETFISPECKHLIVRVSNKESVDLLSQLFETIHHTHFQTSRNFQISNGGFKKMRLLPGIYEVSLTSSIDNRVIWKSELSVEKMEVFNIGDRLSSVNTKVRRKRKG